MPSRAKSRVHTAEAPWLTAEGIDLTRIPIDSLLRQALSPDDEEFRTGCTLLGVMSHCGRVEAGVFLIGLLAQYPHDYGRLTLIAEKLGSFPSPATVGALASELRRVKGSSATRGYLRRVIATLERFPAQLVEAQLLDLSADPQVGPRFRRRLRELLFRDDLR
jgi:hypothetical protein